MEGNLKKPAVRKALYKDDMIHSTHNYLRAFPDLLLSHGEPTIIEQKFFVRNLKHRERVFQGTFHSNTDYALWYGWSEMKRDLTDIKTFASEIRNDKSKKMTFEATGRQGPAN